MNSSKKVIFFGTDDFSVPAFQTLVAGGWDVKIVVTNPDTKAGRGRQPVEPAIKKVAISANVPVLQPDKVGAIADEVNRLAPDVGVLAAYGKLIPQAVLSLFPHGIINIHPSLLPKYRGASPIEAAILNGDDETGVSLMKLNEAMDEGPVYVQQTVKLNGDETQFSLYPDLAKLGAKMLVQNIGDIVSGKLSPKAQDSSQATYVNVLKKADGLIDWSKSAEHYERQVRAYNAWPRSTANIYGHSVIIEKSRVAQDTNDGTLVIKCNPGFLEVLQLVAPSGKTMNSAEFVRGYRS